jgi:hypothetical protein
MSVLHNNDAMIRNPKLEEIKIHSIYKDNISSSLL